MSVWCLVVLDVSHHVEELLQGFFVVQCLQHSALQRDPLLAVVHPVVFHHVERRLADCVEVLRTVFPSRLTVLPFTGPMASLAHA